MLHCVRIYNYHIWKLLQLPSTSSSTTAKYSIVLLVSKIVSLITFNDMSSHNIVIPMSQRVYISYVPLCWGITVGCLF